MLPPPPPLPICRSKDYALFLSHAWDRNAAYELLVQLLNRDPSFRWHNLSIPKSEPVPRLASLPRSNRSLVHELDDRISNAECVLIISGMYCAHRSWIQ